MKKFNIVSKLSLLSNIIIADNDRYGPNGIMLLLFLTKLIIDNGSAMNDAINIVTIDISNPKTNPIKNNNLISPPPKLSFLNIQSPISLNKYRVKNEPTALNKG